MASIPRNRRSLMGALVLGAAFVAQFGVALTAASHQTAAASLIVGILLVAAALLFPRFLLVLVPLATLFPQRVGPAAIDLSVTDALTLLGLVAALPFVPWRDRRVRLVLAGLGVYMAALAVTLLVHHPQRSILEWFHRGVLFGGAVLIGVAIARSGVARPALRLFAAATGIVAGAAIIDTLRTGFGPAYVFQLQKNHAGLVLAIGFLVVLSAAPQLRWPPWLVNVLRAVTLLGLVATQSRAAMLGLVAGIAVQPLLTSRSRNRRVASVGVLLVCLVLVIFTAMSIKATDLSRPADQQKFNSINARTNVYEEAIQKVWLKNRFVGGGLRYFRDPDRAYPTPHNVVIGELAEAGLIGLGGLAVLLGATALALRRSTARLAVLGAMAFVCRLTQGMADVFWVAGPLTIAVLLVGMGLVPTEEEDRAAVPADRDTSAKQSSSTLTVPGRRRLS